VATESDGYDSRSFGQLMAQFGAAQMSGQLGSPNGNMLVRMH
jgi:hypothetical protein